MASSNTRIRRLINAPKIGQSTLYVPSGPKREDPQWALHAEGEFGLASLVWPGDEDYEDFKLSRTASKKDLRPLEKALLESWFEYASSQGDNGGRLGLRGPESFPLRKLSKKEIADGPMTIRFDHPSLERLPYVDYVTVYGWNQLSKHSAHSLQDFEHTIERALVAVRDAWSWWPEGLVIDFFRDERKMGVATVPSWPGDQKRVGLNVILFERYATNAIYRVLVHEIAHHKRFEEGNTSAANAHDSRFCELLAMVDPMVDPKNGCAYFKDDIDYLASPQDSASAKASMFSRLFSGERSPHFGIGDRSVRRNLQRASMRQSFVAVLSEIVARFPADAWRGVEYHALDSHWLFGSPGGGPRTVGELVDGILSNPRIEEWYKDEVRGVINK